MPKSMASYLLGANGWTTDEHGLGWIQHFDRHTGGRTTGPYRLLILDGHTSHHSTGFELYCKENKIITLCMPAHASHILQPLDVGCFGPLKQAYSRHIEDLMRRHITHITKEDFFLSDMVRRLSAGINRGEHSRGLSGSRSCPFQSGKCDLPAGCQATYADAL